MPPKASRRQGRGERANVRQLDQLNLSAQASISASIELPSGAVPRNQLQTLAPPRRNYTPTVLFDPIRVTIMLGIDDGDNFEGLADIEKIETTMGRTATVGQVRGLVTSHKAIHQILNDVYDITIPADHRSTMISFTDAAAYRHKVVFENRWQPDSVFTMWAGEVESGQLGPERACECGDCGGIHGPEIELRLDEAKVKAA